MCDEARGSSGDVAREGDARRNGGDTFGIYTVPPDNRGGGDRFAVQHGGQQAMLEADPNESTALAEPEVEPAPGAPRARTPRPTRWGRCALCGAPLRVVYRDAAGSGYPFLGCSAFKSNNPTTCRYTAVFPPHRLQELPPRVVIRCRVQC